MAVIPQADNTLSVYLELTDKKTGNPLANKKITITFISLETILGGFRPITNSKAVYTNNNGIIDTSINYAYEFDKSSGVKAIFDGDDNYKPLTVLLTER